MQKLTTGQNVENTGLWKAQQQMEHINRSPSQGLGTFTKEAKRLTEERIKSKRCHLDMTRPLYVQTHITYV